jgi:DNA repair protein RadC
MAEAGSLTRLASWNEADFRRLKGIGRVKSGQLVALMEIARRVIGRPSEEGPVLNRADLIASYLRPYTVGLDVEKFWVLCLNRKNRLIKRVEVTSGTATATLAHPREVFRAAIRESACAIVASHSHPSGDPASSSADLEITHLLREAAKTVEITLADHVIILSKPLDKIITWSSRSISTVRAASRNWRVTSISAELGDGSPKGDCARIRLRWLKPGLRSGRLPAGGLAPRWLCQS